jgi:hypothetical protein
MFDPSSFEPRQNDIVARKSHPSIHYRLLGTKQHNGYTMGVIVALSDVNFTTIQTPLLSELVTVELSSLRKLQFMHDATYGDIWQELSGGIGTVEEMIADTFYRG